MIVSEIQNPVKSRRLQVCVLLCAIVVLPLGMAYAQEDEAAGKRPDAAASEIRKAVAEGKITAEEGRAKMAAIREKLDKKSDEAAEKERGADGAKAYLERVKKDLDAAVKAGKISEEDAKKKLQDAAKALKEKMAAARGVGPEKRITPSDILRAEVEIRKAIAEGNLSKEDGRKKMDAMRKMMNEQTAGADRKTTREKYAQAEAELKKLVAEGKISKEDMAARLNGMRKSIADQPGKDEPKKITEEEIGRRLRQAVADGKMSEADARARFEGMRKAMAERGGEARPNWESIKKRIEGAVERGDMTREQADAKYKEIKEGLKKRTEGAEKPGGAARPGWENIKKRIEGAVERGDITREEADAKYKVLRAKMAGARER